MSLNACVTRTFCLLLVLLAVPVCTLAQSNVPGSGWWTGTQIQNVSTNHAALTLSLNPIRFDDSTFDGARGMVTTICGTEGTRVVFGDPDILRADEDKVVFISDEAWRCVNFAPVGVKIRTRVDESGTGTDLFAAFPEGGGKVLVLGVLEAKPRIVGRR